MYKTSVPLHLKANAIYGSYDLMLVFEDGGHGYIGRGSYGLIEKLQYFSGQRQTDPLFRVGNFCEAADCTILVGGNHANNSILNVTLGGSIVLRHASGIKFSREITPATTVVGNAVLFSSKSLVLHGSHVGCGSVIGANEVVRPSVPVGRYSYFAGGRNRRPRLGPEDIAYLERHPWWMAPNSFIVSHLTDIAAKKEVTVPLEKKQPKVILSYLKSKSAEPARIELKGFLSGAEVVDLDSVNPKILSYFKQVSSPEVSLLWTPNIFDVHHL